ncbi:MAG TPA: CocE/NonD family hydrolase [Streptosporangiaceae bacterium]|nr:CocE/NonD family hydrolase [Streptosporangiaceae bacterium]
MKIQGGPGRLDDVAPDFAELLRKPGRIAPPQFAVPDIRVETVMVPMRDGVRLATDIYLPPTVPASAVVVRGPYGRGSDTSVRTFLALARRGFAVVSQDCRGTGGSEPDSWDYLVWESQDSYDFVEWITHQDWSDGFIGALGGSYVGATQWCMAMHPAMSAIMPEVAGLGIAVNTMGAHMFLNSYARSVGKGEDKLDVPFEDLEGVMLDETLTTGYFNELLYKPLPETLLARLPELSGLSPYAAQQRLWAHYCSLTSAGRAAFIKEVTGSPAVTIVEVESLPEIFGRHLPADRHMLPFARMEEAAEALHAPALMVSGWYDWGLNDLFATWDLLNRAAPEAVRSRCRLLIAPSAHNMTGYHEGRDGHPELDRVYRSADILGVLARRCVRTRWTPGQPSSTTSWAPTNGAPPTPGPSPAEPDSYTYNPDDPTPTKGGSIVSYVYPPGSIDVSDIQQRPDVHTYTTEPVPHDLDLAGPLHMTLYATATDTDFVARLSDVFPDGRAIQLQAGALRTRYRDPDSEPSLLQPGHVYQLDIDMWATANRFTAGHRLRIDISSADFPRYDRNTNLGGHPGQPVPARQRIYHDPEHPSHLQARVLPS